MALAYKARAKFVDHKGAANPVARNATNNFAHPLTFDFHPAVELKYQ